MSRRPAVLLTPPRDIPNSSLFLALHALGLIDGSGDGFILDHEIEEHPLPFQSSAHSFLPRSARGAKTPGWHQEPSSNSSTLRRSTCSPATPLDATLTDDLRVLPCFDRSCLLPKPVESTLTELTDFAPVTPLSATLTKNRGRGVLSFRASALTPAVLSVYTGARLSRTAALVERIPDAIAYAG